MDLALGKSSTSSLSTPRHLELVGGVAIGVFVLCTCTLPKTHPHAHNTDICVAIERTDVLFREIYVKLTQVERESV